MLLVQQKTFRNTKIFTKNGKIVFFTTIIIISNVINSLIFYYKIFNINIYVYINYFKNHFAVLSIHSNFKIILKYILHKPLPILFLAHHNPSGSIASAVRLAPSPSCIFRSNL